MSVLNAFIIQQGLLYCYLVVLLSVSFEIIYRLLFYSAEPIGS